MRKVVGYHMVIELQGSPLFKSRAEDILDSLMEISKKAGLSIVGGLKHQFNPEGATAIVLLKESHISIHTWPEHDYAALDIFTCGKVGKEKSERVLELIKETFKPKHIEIHMSRTRGPSKNI